MILKHEWFKTGEEIPTEVIVAMNKGLVLESDFDSDSQLLHVWFGGYETPTVEHDHAD